MSDDGTVTIRSFRLAFELERRIHKIDRWRIPVPYGVPLRALAYAVAALAVVLVLGRLPVLGLLLDEVPWPIRYGVLPIGAAQLLTQVQVDGRPAHDVLVVWMRLRVQPRRSIAFASTRARVRERMNEVLVVPDERHVEYRRGAIEGAGPVVLRRPAELDPRGRRLLVRPSDGTAFRAKRVLLKPGQRVVVA
ncbi:MAG TPA: hypothetical protein VN238_17765 [Solirubrobacteraceae bacterium]|nr:hypothetical protein [Solirubrobacteraceae bacterium]